VKLVGSIVVFEPENLAAQPGRLTQSRLPIMTSQHGKAILGLHCSIFFLSLKNGQGLMLTLAVKKLCQSKQRRFAVLCRE
jgi:hypothetical protein